MNFTKSILLTMLAALPVAAQIPVNCGDTLNVPGGYYVLTGNLTCPSVPSVHITADNVTFDLKGFILSKSGPGVGAAIITAAGSSCLAITGTTIQNGTITGFGTAVSICVPGSSSVSTHSQVHHMVL